MEASRRDGLRYSEERTTEKEWMKKQKKVVNTGQIKEHELTWRNKVKLRRKREGRLWKTVGEIGGRNWRGKGGKKENIKEFFLPRKAACWKLNTNSLSVCERQSSGFMYRVPPPASAWRIRWYCVCVCVCRPMCAQFPGVIVNCQSGVPPTEIY